MDRALLHVIWREAVNRCTVLQGRVREGKDVLAASEFARWLQFSGVIKLLEAFPSSEPLRVDGAFLRKAAESLAYDAGQVLRSGKVVADTSNLEAINLRLAAIEEKLSLPAQGVVAASPVPVLRLLDGGKETSEAANGR